MYNGFSNKHPRKDLGTSYFSFLHSIMTQLSVLLRNCKTCPLAPQLVSSNSLRFLRLDKEQRVDGAMFTQPAVKFIEALLLMIHIDTFLLFAAICIYHNT